MGSIFEEDKVLRERIDEYFRANREATIPQLQTEFKRDYYSVRLAVSSLVSEGKIRPASGIRFVTFSEKETDAREEQEEDDPVILAAEWERRDFEERKKRIEERRRRLEERRQVLLNSIKLDKESRREQEAEEVPWEDIPPMMRDIMKVLGEENFRRCSSDMVCLELAMGGDPDLPHRFELRWDGYGAYLTDAGFSLRSKDKERAPEEIVRILRQHGVMWAEDELRICVNSSSALTGLLQLYAASVRIITEL